MYEIHKITYYLFNLRIVFIIYTNVCSIYNNK